MRVIIQAIVIFVALSVVLLGLGRRSTHIGKAWKKLGVFLLAIAMVVAVLFPDSTNKLAHFVGVGRGADLLLYILTLAFITYALNNYIKQQDDRDTLIRLARKIALLEATEHYKDRK